MSEENENCLFQNEKNVVLNKIRVEGKPCSINIEVRALRSQFSYTVVMMNMNLLSVVTPPSIYRLLICDHQDSELDSCGTRMSTSQPLLTNKKITKALWDSVYKLYKMGEKIVIFLHIYGARANFLLFYDHQETKSE